MISRSLWDFIADDLTRRLYQTIHAKVRSTGQTFVLPIRCDSPTLVREMQLRIFPRPSGELLYATSLMNVEVRPPAAILDRDCPRAQSFLTMCSCCLNCLIEPLGWLGLENVVQRFPANLVAELQNPLMGQLEIGPDIPKSSSLAEFLVNLPVCL